MKRVSSVLLVVILALGSCAPALEAKPRSKGGGPISPIGPAVRVQISEDGTAGLNVRRPQGPAIAKKT